MNDIIRISSVMDRLGLFNQADLLFKIATEEYKDDLSQLFPDPDEVAKIMAKKSNGYYFINDPQRKKTYPLVSLQKLEQTQSRGDMPFYSLYVLHNGYIIRGGPGYHHVDIIENMLEHYTEKYPYEKRYNQVYHLIDNIDRYHLVDKILHGAIRVYISDRSYDEPSHDLSYEESLVYPKYKMTINGYSYITDAMIKSLKIIEKYYQVKLIDVEFRYIDNKTKQLKNIYKIGLTSIDSLIPMISYFNKRLSGFENDLTEEKEQELEKLRQFLMHDFSSRAVKITPDIRQMLNNLKKSNLTQEDIKNLVSTYSGKTKAEQNYYSKPGG